MIHEITAFAPSEGYRWCCRSPVGNFPPSLFGLKQDKYWVLSGYFLENGDIQQVLWAQPSAYNSFATNEIRKHLNQDLGPLLWDSMEKAEEGVKKLRTLKIKGLFYRHGKQIPLEFALFKDSI